MPEVELYELGPSVLVELAKDLTPPRMAHVERQLRRLEEHGRKLGPNYFEKVKGSRRDWARSGSLRIRLRFVSCIARKVTCSSCSWGFPKRAWASPPT